MAKASPKPSPRFLLFGYIRPAFHDHSSWEEWTAAADSYDEIARLAEPFGDEPGSPRTDQLTGYDAVSLALSCVAAGASHGIEIPSIACRYDPSGLGLGIRRQLQELGWVPTKDE
jgi:hypothetical protein